MNNLLVYNLFGFFGFEKFGQAVRPDEDTLCP